MLLDHRYIACHAVAIGTEEHGDDLISNINYASYHVDGINSFKRNVVIISDGLRSCKLRTFSHLIYIL